MNPCQSVYTNIEYWLNLKQRLTPDLSININHVNCIYCNELCPVNIKHSQLQDIILFTEISRNYYNLKFVNLSVYTILVIAEEVYRLA